MGGEDEGEVGAEAEVVRRTAAESEVYASTAVP